MALEGFAERPAGGLIQGWAWDTEEPEQALVVEAFDGGAFYQQATAAGFRPDLQAANRRAGHCLFEIAAVPDGAAIHVLIDGTAHRLRSALDAGPDAGPDGGPDEGDGAMLGWLDGAGAALRPNLLVQRLCHDIIGRSATPLELLRFAGRTETPYGLVRLVRDILDEAPATGLVTHRDVIRQAYLGVLGRAADPDGLNGFAQELLAGSPISQMIRDLVTSPEFTAQHVKEVKPDGRAELEALARALQAAITTLTLHGAAGHPAAGPAAAMPGPLPPADG